MRATLFLVIVLSAAPAIAAEAPPLPRLASLDAAPVTVSGLSSGAFFAHQFHVAHSSLVEGAGIVAGGPYACAEQTGRPWWLALGPNANTIVALGVCTRFSRLVWGLAEAPDATQSVAAIRAAAARGEIDDPAGLRNARVWLFSGAADTLVPQAVVDAVADVYRAFGVTALEQVTDARAAHGLPVEELTDTDGHPRRACGDQGPPFIIRCGRDAAEGLLAQLHPAGFVRPAAAPDRARWAAFDQRAFFDRSETRTSLAEVGFLYVPAACAPGGSGGCRLHVAFHGCLQNAAAVGDDFVWDGGYNRWAEANRIVVLYPQTVAWSLGGNPNACWDWWGYSGFRYLGRDGPQMRAVRAMIGRLTGR